MFVLRASAGSAVEYNPLGLARNQLRDGVLSCGTHALRAYVGDEWTGVTIECTETGPLRFRTTDTYRWDPMTVCLAYLCDEAEDQPRSRAVRPDVCSEILLRFCDPGPDGNVYRVNRARADALCSTTLYLRSSGAAGGHLTTTMARTATRASLMAANAIVMGKAVGRRYMHFDVVRVGEALVLEWHPVWQDTMRMIDPDAQHLIRRCDEVRVADEYFDARDEAFLQSLSTSPPERRPNRVRRSNIDRVYVIDRILAANHELLPMFMGPRMPDSVGAVGPALLRLIVRLQGMDN